MIKKWIGLLLYSLCMSAADGSQLLELTRTNDAPVLIKTLDEFTIEPGGRYEIEAHFEVRERRNTQNAFYLKVECDQGWETWPDKLVLRGHHRNEDECFKGSRRYQVEISDAAENVRLSLYGQGSGTVVLHEVSVRKLDQLSEEEVYDEALLQTVKDSEPYEPYGMCAHVDWSLEIRNGQKYGTYTDAELKKTVDFWSALGIQWLRLSVIWEHLFPDARGEVCETYLSRCEKVMDLCDAAGIKYYLQLGATPRWASSRPDEKDFWAYPPKDSRDFDDYVRFIAKRFGNRITHYEIGNETDWHFWHGTDREYVSQLIRSAVILKALDNDALVLNGGLSSDGVYGSGHKHMRNGYLQTLFDLGAGPYIDIFNEHMYTADITQALYRINRFYRVMKENDAGDKPIWITEIGYSTFKERTDEQQAAYIRDMYTVLLAHPKVDKVFLYNFRCKGDNNEEMEDRFGIVERDFTPRPAFHALKQIPKRSVRLVNPRFLTIDFPEAE